MHIRGVTISLVNPYLQKMGDTEINTFTDIVKTYMQYIEGDEDGGGEHEDTERGTCVCSRENG